MQHLVQFKVFESTTHYLPSLSDDATADRVSAIMRQASTTVNAELKKAEDEIINYRYDDSIHSVALQQLLQKWMYANMIMTALQKGMFIEAALIQRAQQLYEEVLSADYTQIEQDASWQRMFKQQLEAVLEQVKQLRPLDDGMYYAPGFMEAEARQLTQQYDNS